MLAFRVTPRSAVLEFTPRDSNNDAAEGPITCRDAFSGEHLAEVARMGAPEVHDAVASARAAVPAWRDATDGDRRRVLATLLDELVTAQDELCRLAAHESGKTMIQALLGDVLPTCSSTHQTIRRLARPRPGSPNAQPHGVVGILASCRFPLQSIVSPVVAALADGQGAVVKLSEHASWSGEMFVEIIRNVLRQHGQDPALVVSVTGGRRTLAALVETRLDRIVGGGSDDEGRDLLTQAARSLTPVRWQRHGNETMVVAEDADLDRAVKAAMLGALTPLPPPLIAAERILVHARLHDAFVEAARCGIGALRCGAPLEEGIDNGPVAPSVGVEHLRNLIDDAVRCGATVLIGGETDPALASTHVSPTLLVDVPPHARVVNEPTFGPVMSVVRVQSDAEAVALANDAPSGAGISLFCRRGTRARAHAERLRSSNVRINEIGLAEALRAGAGATLLPVPSPYPSGPHTYALFESLLRLRFGRGVRQRLRAATELVPWNRR
jgi:acyl-CoA reductase-like NAD-dependent aldehyde dehydrogenase